jgi:hypothetical protein
VDFVHNNLFSEFHVSDGLTVLRFVAIKLTSEGRMRGNWIRNLLLKKYEIKN